MCIILRLKYSSKKGFIRTLFMPGWLLLLLLVPVDAVAAIAAVSWCHIVVVAVGSFCQLAFAWTFFFCSLHFVVNSVFRNFQHREQASGCIYTRSPRNRSLYCKPKSNDTKSTKYKYQSQRKEHTNTHTNEIYSTKHNKNIYLNWLWNFWRKRVHFN